MAADELAAAQREARIWQMEAGLRGDMAAEAIRNAREIRDVSAFLRLEIARLGRELEAERKARRRARGLLAALYARWATVQDLLPDGLAAAIQGVLRGR